MARRSSPKRSLRLPTATIYECARCGRAHHGAGTPPGWAAHQGHGLLCDDCDEAMRLSALTGIPLGQRAA
ncbi:MAG: hypothetical protein BGO57_13290 [Sphingomonadales bacterium 63-6]|nr:MAG: hypothetical protein BGO57_13290 [Sphingomonadales bacterium 63-6]